mmetsp:Transcript_48933/g.131783  ORF Transcript_48933/g.131783 Transcript_48933/m.131783 type:complete len:272 (-) Transcript_48933:1134-1949(-)
MAYPCQNVTLRSSSQRAGPEPAGAQRSNASAPGWAGTRRHTSPPSRASGHALTRLPAGTQPCGRAASPASDTRRRGACSALTPCGTIITTPSTTRTTLSAPAPHVNREAAAETANSYSCRASPLGLASADCSTSSFPSSTPASQQPRGPRAAFAGGTRSAPRASSFRSGDPLQVTIIGSVITTPSLLSATRQSESPLVDLSILPLRRRSPLLPTGSCRVCGLGASSSFPPVARRRHSRGRKKNQTTLPAEDSSSPVKTAYTKITSAMPERD